MNTELFFKLLFLVSLTSAIIGWYRAGGKDEAEIVLGVLWHMCMSWVTFGVILGLIWVFWW